MKQFSIVLLALAIIVSSCTKSSSDASKSDTPSTPVVAKAPPPTADFKINNAISTTTVWEGLALDLQNTSANGDSYFWDFGNGVTSTERAPANVSLFPCGLTYTISLTVTGKDGQSNTYSAPYYIQCSRGMPFAIHK
jgi:PKD repeat protein